MLRKDLACTIISAYDMLRKDLAYTKRVIISITPLINVFNES